MTPLLWKFCKEAGTKAMPSPAADAYASVSGASLQGFKEMDGQQPGNPRSAAQAIIQAVESPHPPMRLALGTDAISLIQEKLEWVKTDLEAWQQVTVSTNYTDSNN